MIYWFFENYFATGGLAIRIAGAGVLSFTLVMLMARPTIRFLVRRKFKDIPEFDHADLNELTRHKSKTPTMGGIMIVASIFLTVVLFADLSNMYIYSGLLALIWLGGLGAVDDWLKLRYSPGSGSRDGLKSWEKLVFQIGLCVLLSVFVWKFGRYSYVVSRTGERLSDVNLAHSFHLPFGIPPIALPFIAYAFIMIVVMVGSSNAVNLTDGMDGLAAGNLLIVVSVFLGISWVVGVWEWADFFAMPFVRYEAEMTILCAAIMGSLLGFLWFNASPAQVFMGDTGSLPLGGLLGYIAIITRQELVLLVAGGVFVMEAGSVMLQVGYYKMTKGPSGKGKRIFRCAPIHHHFHLGGWPETKVVIRFWLLGIIFAVLALAMLKLR